MAITFQIGFQVNDKELRSGLQGIQKDIENAFNIKSGMSEELAKATQQATILQNALKRATSDKGISFYTLNSELNKAGTSAKQLVTTLAAGGSNFTASLNAANTALARANRNVIALNSKIKEMARVLTQSFKFTAAQTFLQGISSAAREAYQWVYDLDKTITNIGVVTGYTGDQLDKVTQNAIAGAKELRIAANDYAEGALIFYQQGLGDDEVARRVEITAKSARAAGTSLEQMSSQLTAIWNTYQMTGDEMERAASVGAKMAGDTAVDFADIAEAMQTAAAPAEQMGVSYNSLAAIIATVGDTTQQSASVIGNAFKTIFSRFQQLKSSGTDGEVTLNRISSQLQELGINVLDAGGELRDLDTVIMEVGNQWDNWSSKQQLAIAQLVGGTRQYGQFLTLMNNFDKYQKLLSSANLEDGSTLEQQYQSSLQSIESYAENAGEAWRRAFSNAIDEDVVKGFYKGAEELGDVFNRLLDTIGGLPGILVIAAGIFSSKLIPASANFLKNVKESVVNLTPTGRAKSINKQFGEIDTSLNQRMAKVQERADSKGDLSISDKNELESLQIAKQKNEYSRQTAQINDKINSQLKNANGAYKISLQYQKQQLESAQDLYNMTVDQLAVLKQQAQQQTKNIQLERKRLQQNVDKTAQRQDNATIAYTQAADAYQKDPTSANKAALIKAEQELKIATELATQAKLEQDAAFGSNDEFLKAREAISNFNAELAKLGSQGGKSSAAYKALINSLEEMKNAGMMAEEEFTKIMQILKKPMSEKNIEKVNNLIDELGINSEEACAKILQLAEQADSLTGEDIEKINNQINNMDGLSDKAKQAIIELNNQLNTEKDQKITEAAMAMADLTTKTEKATAAQKELSQTQATADAMADLGQARSRKATVGDSINGFEITQTKGQAFMGIIGGLGQVASAAAMATAGIQMMMDTIQDEDASAAEKIFAIVTALSMIAPAIELGATAMKMFKTGVQNLIPQLVSVGTTGTAAGTATGLAGYIAQAGWLPFIAIATAIIALLAGIVIGVQALIQAAHDRSLEGQLENANEQLEAMNTLVESVNSKVDELKSSWSEYEEVKKILDDCTYGTEEWRDALQAVNQKVLEILQTYPELAQYVNRDDTTGELSLDEEGYNKYLDKQQEAQTSAQAAQYAAQNRVNSLENDIAKQDIIDDIGEYMSDATGGLSMKNETKDMLSANMDRFVGLTGEALAEEVKKVNEENGSSMQDKYMDDFIKAIEEASVDINAWDTAVQGATDAAKLQSEEIAKNYLESQNFNVEKGTEGIYSNLYDSLYKQAQASVEKDYKDSSLEDIAKDYAKEYGIDLDKAEYDGDTVTLEDGTEYKKEEMLAALASAEALDGLTAAAEGANKTLQALDNEDNQSVGGAEFKDFLATGNFNSMDEDDIAERAGYDDETMTNWLEDLFDTDDLEATAKSLGYENADALIAGVREGFTNSQKELDNIGKNFSERAKSIFDNIDLSGMSVNAQKSVADTFDQIYQDQGAEAAQSFANIFAGMDPTNAELLAENIDKIDWQDASPEYIREQFEELGIPMDALSDETLPKLIDLMQQASQIDFSSAAESVKAGQDIISSIEGNASSISEDQVTQLEQLGIDADAYFQKMADGTYQLTMDADAFKQMVHDVSMKDMRDFADQEASRYLDLNDIYQQMTQNLTAFANDTQMQYNALEATGSLTQGELSDLYVNGSLDAEKVKQAYAEAGISADSIKQSMQGAAEQASSAQKAIEDADYQYEVESAGLDQEETDRYAARIAESLKEQDEAAGDTVKSMEEYERLGREAAIANQKLDRGLKNLNENLDDYKKKLKNANKGTAEWSEAMDSLKTDLADIVNFDDPDLITDDFAEATLESEDLKAALDGDVEAIQRLQTAAADDMMINIVANQSTTPDQIKSQWEQLKLDFANFGDLTAPGVDQTELINSFNAMIANGKMTKDQIEAAMAGLHVQAKLKTTYTTQTQQVPLQVTEEYSAPVEWKEATYTNAEGETVTEKRPLFKRYTKSYTAGYEEAEVTVPSYEIEGTTDESGNTVAFVDAPAPTPSYGSTTSGIRDSGGGGGSSKAPEKKDDPGKRESLKIEDRYSTVQAAIDDTQRSLDRLDDTMSDMWGGVKLAALRKYNKELWQQAENLKAMLALAERYKREDAAAAIASQIEAEGVLGGQIVDLEFNDDGFISNRTEVINSIDDLLQASYDAYYNALMDYNAAVEAGTATEAMSENVDKLKDNYDDLDEAAQNYIEDMDLSDETAQKYIDTLNDLVELIRTEISNRIETITYRIELRTDMNDLEIENLERSIEHLGDVGILTGSKIGLLGDVFGKAKDNAWEAVGGFNSLVEVLNNLNSAAGQEYFIEKYGQEAWDEYAKDGILPEELVSGLQNYIKDMMSSVDDMYSKMEDMFDTYLDLLSMYADKFDQIADKLSLNASKLDVYQELLEFSGQQYNGRQGQEARKAIADARISTSRTNLELSQAKFETYKEQYDEWMKQVEDFQAVHGDDIASYDEATAAAWNKIDETRQELYTQMQESEEEIYSNMSELVQNVADAIEVGAQIIKEQVVESLDGLFNDFASMTETWDQMETLRLFFLEDYDKTYQLDSLLRDINKAMEDVTDPKRMNEYLALVEEINAANQEGIDMTQTDVDLLKAKFELQKAQDAYEEQMNAKNTMRLARDASGNWNYVYSDDTSQTEDAVQALADAQYNYDKLLHEARDESSQLWLQTQQKFFEWQEQIDQSRLEWDTAYREQVQRTYDYYLTLTERYAGQVEKYNGMLGDSYSDTTLGIITNYDSMKAAQEAYTEQHAIYHTKLEENTKQYQGVVNEATDIIGIDYDNMASEVYGAAQEIMSTNSVLEGDIQDLQATASSALSAMSADVWANVNSMISAIQALEAEIQAALALLRQLTEKSTNGGNTAFDANRNYTATGYNYLIDYAKSIGKDVNELTRQDVNNAFSTEQGKLIAEEFGNKTSDKGLYGKTDWYNGKTAQDFVDNMYDAVKNGVIDGQKKYDEGDTSGPANQVGDKGSWYNDRYGTPRTASGGLIRTPQVRSVAEDGAELILNSTDTQNILDAVRNMREVVRMRMSSMNTGIAKKTESNAEKTVINKDIQQVDQTVSIDATFPNVSVAAEIEEALNNLINQAVQYATRNNR